MGIEELVLNGSLNRMGNTSPPKQTDWLKRLAATKAYILKRSQESIEFSKPILQQGQNPIIFPNTINVIQGKSGVHKSRLAELFAASFLSKGQYNILDLALNINRKYTVIYVDTERNYKDQFPFAIQKIKQLAGYEKTDTLVNLEPISLIEVPREKRFEVLELYLNEFRNTVNDRHLIIVLDVITDCVENFNDPAKSLRLIDLMNKMINEFDLTFIAVIHENPGQSEKARGHLGSEIENKATTQIQISKMNSEVFKINFKKTRNTKALEPIHVSYSDELKTLVLADPAAVKTAQENRKEKAKLSEVKLKILEILKEPMSKKEILNILKTTFNCGNRTIEERLKTLIDENTELIDKDGTIYILDKMQEGRKIYFLLIKKPIL